MVTTAPVKRANRSPRELAIGLSLESERPVGSGASDWAWLYHDAYYITRRMGNIVLSTRFVYCINPKNPSFMTVVDACRSKESLYP